MVTLRVRDWQNVPMGTEVFSNDRVIWFAHLAVLRMREYSVKSCKSQMIKERTMNLRSLENVNLRTAIMRSNASSESFTLSDQCQLAEGANKRARANRRDR